MPFRERVRRVLKGGSASDDDPPYAELTLASSRQSRKDKKNWPENIYKPGEVLPLPKYRGAYNQEHQAKLKAFDWGKARRNSEKTILSDYSPMGSRPSSRASNLRSNALVGLGFRRRGIGSRQASSNHGSLPTTPGSPSKLSHVSPVRPRFNRGYSGLSGAVSLGSTRKAHV